MKFLLVGLLAVTAQVQWVAAICNQDCDGVGCDQEACFGQTLGLYNLARGRPTVQSSLGFYGDSSRSVDGNPYGLWAGASCSHTALENNPWWMVDLGVRAFVTGVVIVNRQDCCGDRTKNFDIIVTDRYVSTSKPPVADDGLCFYQAGQSGKRQAYKCTNLMRGRYVIIRLRDRNYLNICEVLVFGKASGKRNLSAGKTALSSSVGFGGVPDRVIDGRRLLMWAEASCAHTNLQDNPWIAVDLGKTKTVTDVVVANRQDCCANRLSNWRIIVTNRSPAGLAANDVKDEEICRRLTLTQPALERGYECRQKMRGRYVIVQLLRKDYLNICEITVIGNDAGATDLS